MGQYATSEVEILRFLWATVAPHHNLIFHTYPDTMHVTRDLTWLHKRIFNNLLGIFDNITREEY